MFETTDLTNKLGYENWVIKESLLAIEQNNGTISDRTIRFKTDGVASHSFVLKDSFSSFKSLDIIEKLSPLLFVTTYKILDMVFEWILDENTDRVPWRFSEKINLYNEIKQNSDFHVPEIIQDEQELLDIMFSLYENLAIYRNKIIHGAWGSINKGDLSFSFIHSEVPFEKEISFKEVLNFSEAVTLFVNEITIPSENSSFVFKTTKYLLDQIQDLHNGMRFNISKPSHYKVE